MGNITIVGLGPGPLGLVTLATWEKIKMAKTLALRTAKHPAAEDLRARGVAFVSYDSAYESGASFDAVYRTIADDLLRRAAAGEAVVYAVPGSPLVAEKTVALVRARAKKTGVPVEILPGMSFLEVLYTKLGIDPIDGLTVIDAADADKLEDRPQTGLVITQVYNRRIASELKLGLMELYNDDTEIWLARNLGLEDEEIRPLPLFELDRQTAIDHLTSVYLPPRPEVKQRFDLAPLKEVMATLRSPGGCVWDIEQTHRSLRRNLIEETYEVLEAIEFADEALFCEELGDLLLQIVFHARMAEEAGQFGMQDVVDGITQKLIRRHPHVFGDVTVRDAGEVVLNWEAIKKREKSATRKKILDGIPKSLPALMKATKMQQKAAKVGFDWNNIAPVWDKIKEEIAELKTAIAEKDERHIEEELGDVLFSVVNLSRFIGVDAETALHTTNLKFARRFSYIEEEVARQGLKWENMCLEELDRLWNASKALNL